MVIQNYVKKHVLPIKQPSLSKVFDFECENGENSGNEL